MSVLQSHKGGALMTGVGTSFPVLAFLYTDRQLVDNAVLSGEATYVGLYQYQSLTGPRKIRAFKLIDTRDASTGNSEFGSAASSSEGTKAADRPAKGKGKNESRRQAQSHHTYPEKWYRARWCAEQSGQAEVALRDGTQADCVTGTHALKFDFGPMWAEAIGQALFYSQQTGKRAGIVLILEDPKDRSFWTRLNSTIQHFGLPMDTWAIGKGAP